jgi:hypothetical protein
MIIVGFLASGAVLKFCGYPDAVFVRWNPLAVFLREHVGWLLLIPIAWVFFATCAERIAPDGISHAVAYAVGVYIPPITIAFFLYAAIYPYTRPIFIGVPKRSTANRVTRGIETPAHTPPDMWVASGGSNRTLDRTPLPGP